MDASRKLWYNPVPESEDGESASDSSSPTTARTHANGGRGGESNSATEHAFDFDHNGDGEAEEEGKETKKKSRKRGRGEGAANKAAAVNHPSLRRDQKRLRRISLALVQRGRAHREDHPMQKMAAPVKFSAEAEMALSSAVLCHVQSGSGLPSRSSDEPWNSIVGAHTKEQLCEKLRRMRQKYLMIATKRANPKNGHEEALFHIWNQIWGGNPAKIEKKKKKDSAAKVPPKEDTAAKVPPKEDTAAKVHQKEDAAAKVHQKEGSNQRRVESPTQQQEPMPNLGSNPAFMMELQSFLNSEKDTLIGTIQTACEQLPQAAVMLAGTSFASTMLGSGIEDAAAYSALKDKWCKQRLQELKVFSERLQLMKEHCSLQKQQLESQLRTGKF